MFLFNQIKAKIKMPIVPMVCTVIIMGLCGAGAFYALGIITGSQSVLGISLLPVDSVIGVGFLQGCALLALSLTVYYLWMELGLEYWLSHLKGKKPTIRNQTK